MRWELSQEQADFRSVLRDWLQERCPSPTLRGWLDSGDHSAFEQQFIAEGWFGVGSPEKVGGQGGGLVELALAAEELGRRAVPSSAWMGSMLAAVLAAADALGVSERMLEMTVEYSAQRHQFGVPIGSFQAVKHAAAQMLVHVESARSIAYLAAASVELSYKRATLGRRLFGAPSSWNERIAEALHLVPGGSPAPLPEGGARWTSI